MWSIVVCETSWFTFTAEAFCELIPIPNFQRSHQKVVIDYISVWVNCFEVGTCRKFCNYIGTCKKNVKLERIRECCLWNTSLELWLKLKLSPKIVTKVFDVKFCMLKAICQFTDRLILITRISLGFRSVFVNILWLC